MSEDTLISNKNEIRTITIDENGRVDASVKHSTGVRVSWEDKKTESDIQIAGGPTTVKRSGILCSIMPMPHPNDPRQVIPTALVAGDDKQWHAIMPFDRCKIQ